MDMKQTNLIIDEKTKLDMQLEIKLEKQIKMILAEQFIDKDVELDKKKGIDFLIFNVNPFKVGVRLRRYEYYKNNEYRNQFTIRWTRPTGNETEIDKIRKGYVDYILYGFVDSSEENIIQYFIGNLEIFRKNEPNPIYTPTNHDKRKSQLAVYALKQFPPNFIVSSENLDSDYNQKKLSEDT